MTMNLQHPGVTENTSTSLGAKLQSAREALRLDRKDAAAKLRLNESVIDMMENDSFPASMPSIFVRGYIRAYGKLLDLPEDIISAGLEPIKSQATSQEATSIPVAVIESTHRRRQYLMKGATTVIALSLFGLVGAWWHSHANAPQPENIALAVPTETIPDTVDATPAPAGLIIMPPQARTTASLPVSNTLPAEPNLMRASTPIAIAPEKLASLTPPNPAQVAPTATAPATAPANKSIADASIPAYKRAAMAAVSKPITEENTETEVE